jgi:hypothetical protein
MPIATITQMPIAALAATSQRILPLAAGTCDGSNRMVAPLCDTQNSCLHMGHRLERPPQVFRPVTGSDSQNVHMLS